MFLPPRPVSSRVAAGREAFLVDWTARSLLEWVTFPRGTPGDYGAVTSFSWWFGIFCLCPFLKSQSWAVSLRSRRREAFPNRPLSLRTPVSECAQAAADCVITIPEISEGGGVALGLQFRELPGRSSPSIFSGNGLRIPVCAHVYAGTHVCAGV